jgi:MFS family permease
VLLLGCAGTNNVLKTLLFLSRTSQPLLKSEVYWDMEECLLGAPVGTMLSMIIVGFATNFYVALAGRAIGGLLNGNIGVIQTMVGELATKPEHEPRAYSVLPFVWTIGTIIGPAIGGYFANPSERFPGLFAKDGNFGRLPFLLPNLICAGLLLASILMGYFLLEETHPDMQPRVSLPDATYMYGHFLFYFPNAPVVLDIES